MLIITLSSKRLCDPHDVISLIFNVTSQSDNHRVASTPELATNFIDYKQIAGMTTVRKSCYYTVLSGVML